jgi:type IV pilus assembly protein PilQ
VSGSITLRLKDVPWDQAMDIILQTRGLDMRKNGNVIWVAPRDELATREKLALEAQQQIGELEATRTESFQMNYQKAIDVQRLLGDKNQPILSKRGSAVVDARTNTLFVQDVPARLEDVRKLLAKIDVPVRQVVIEARIVIADDSFSKNLGARLGYNSVGSQIPGGNTQARNLNANLGGPLENLATNPSFGTVTSNAAQNVVLPASGLNGFSPGAFSLLLFNNSFTRVISAEITAMEADGKGKTVSSPRVLTSDGVEAIIEQGTEIPYQQASSSGATSVSFRKANLALKVKPQITPEGNVIMDLDVNKDEPGATTTAGVQISTKHVKTSALVENGGTVVIGGIYEETERQDITRVPFFGELPYVGFLFKNTARSTRKTELLIFITPRVVSERLTVR